MIRPLLATLFCPSPSALLRPLTPSPVAEWCPGSEARAAEPEKIEGSNVCNVHKPTITPYVPAADKSTGTAVIICPGAVTPSFASAMRATLWLNGFGITASPPLC